MLSVLWNPEFISISTSSSSQGNSLILGQFDSGIIQTGQTFRYTFNDPGTFEYYCTLHPSMVGKIVVS
jgi:plastocyanin